MNPPTVVIDVGGTHLRWARWSPEEGLTERSVRPAPGRRQHPQATVTQLRALMVRALSDAVPAEPGVVAGVSFGAALDHRTGVVYGSAPLWGPAGSPFDLLGAVREVRPDVDWHLVNDVTAALFHFASAPGREHHRKVLLATVSTGIACRVMDRRTGAVPVDGCGLQGEIGHLPATAALLGRSVELGCDCGVLGHVAAYSSGPGIARMTEVLRQRAPREWQNGAVQAGLRAGQPFESAFRTALDSADPLARELLSSVTSPVADVLRTALCLDPEIDEIALTGGVAVGLGAHYRNAILAHLERRGLYLTSDRSPQWVADRITVCASGEADGLVGAGIAATTGAAATARGKGTPAPEAPGGGVLGDQAPVRQGRSHEIGEVYV
ncbi:ROK family protein [Streptomyces sp. NPDC048442]|uniref:ROK family protein n=1 Tax=Streptomyces sp. NPDC048442 TaxID=3154823 RepID=UPI00341A4562